MVPDLCSLSASQERARVQVARGVIGLVVTGHYPLNHHPARLAVEHLEQYSFGWKEISQWFSYLQSVIFVLSTTAVAVVVRAMSHQQRGAALASGPCG